jgi:hypothetical protein
VAAVILNRFIEILLCLVRSLMQTIPSGQVFQKLRLLYTWMRLKTQCQN